MSVPAQLDNNKETHDGFLPGLWPCFSRKFVYYRFSGMPSIEKYHWSTGEQKLPDIVMSLLIDEQEA